MKPEIVEILKILGSMLIEKGNNFCFCFIFSAERSLEFLEHERHEKKLSQIEQMEWIRAVMAEPELREKMEVAISEPKISESEYAKKKSYYLKTIENRKKMRENYEKLSFRDKELLQISFTGNSASIDYSNLKIGSHRSIDEFPPNICAHLDELILNAVKVFAKSEE